MKKIFCIIGRTSSGKSSLTKAVAEDLGLKILKSYATRPMRNNETEDNSDHIFISKEEISHYAGDMIAYTEINGFPYFATKSQLYKSDIYIIDALGYEELYKKVQNTDIQLVPIYITVSKKVALERAKKRGDDLETFLQRYEAENEQFSKFEKSDLIWYRVLNHGTFEEGVEKLKRIINKER